MFKYILKRLLLIIPTFIGATFLVFTILNAIPDGPLERAVAQLQSGGVGGGGGDSVAGGSDRETVINEKVLEMLRKQYGLDKPFLVRYLLWLGLYPRETKSKTVNYGKAFRENLKIVDDPETGKRFFIQRWIRPELEDGKVVVYKSGKGGDFAFGNVPELPSSSDITQWNKSNDWDIEKFDDNEVSLSQFAVSGILQGDFGTSYQHNEKVTKLIGDRLHISLFFGLISFFVTYLVCIPLGISKALKHNSTYDVSTSALIFMGYSIPPYALGVLLLMLFGSGVFTGLKIFPLGGFRSPNFDELSFIGKVFDQMHHAILPIICYMIGAFATLTILMKNSLMENLSQDYVRTAFAKGLPENTIIYKHALRNSLIPIATGLGRIVGIFLTGSYLIEYVFNIDGIGLLSYNAIVNMDYPIFLAFTVFSILTLLVGNLISDILYVLIDPRIKFT